MIPHQRLEVVNLAVVRAIGRIGADHFGLLPHALKIILHDAATMALRSERERAGYMVFRMRRRDRERVAEFVERDLLLDGVGELAADFAAGERPLHLHAAEILHELFLRRDELGLIVAEIETVAQTEAGYAVLAVERGQGDVLAERQLG